MLDEIVNEFVDKIDLKDYFSYANFEIVKDAILSSKSNIIFLLGNPGSGKSFLLNYLYHFHDNYVLINEPFESRIEFFEKAKEIVNKKILVDEAQLLNMEMLEFLRTLSDRGHQIILAMHKEEGEKIISLPQFFSRYNERIYLKPLTYEEFEKYVKFKLIKRNKIGLIDNKRLKKMYKICKGNFRLCKRMMFTALELLDYSLRNSLKYKTIDNCILTMTKIKLGLK